MHMSSGVHILLGATGKAFTMYMSSDVHILLGATGIGARWLHDLVERNNVGLQQTRQLADFIRQESDANPTDILPQGRERGDPTDILPQGRERGDPTVILPQGRERGDPTPNASPPIFQYSLVQPTFSVI